MLLYRHAAQIFISFGRLACWRNKKISPLAFILYSPITIILCTRWHRLENRSHDIINNIVMTPPGWQPGTIDHMTQSMTLLQQWLVRDCDSYQTDEKFPHWAVCIMDAVPSWLTGCGQVGWWYIIKNVTILTHHINVVSHSN